MIPRPIWTHSKHALNARPLNSALQAFALAQPVSPIQPAPDWIPGYMMAVMAAWITWPDTPNFVSTLSILFRAQ